jgi:hypothetical protein
MNILEHEIEDIVWQAISNKQYDTLKERGLHVFDKLTYFRQLGLSTYGRCDVLGVMVKPMEPGDKRRTFYIHVLEFKKDKVGVNTYLQALRYAKGVQEKIEYLYNTVFDFKIRIYLIGKEVEESPLTLSCDLLDHLFIYTYNIDLFKGITFSLHHGDYLGDAEFDYTDKEFRQILCYNLMKQYGREPNRKEELPF